MGSLAGKNLVVIGASRGVGRAIVEEGARAGARVLAVARGEASLRELATDVPGIATLALDAADEGAPQKVFDALRPDVLVLCAGALTPTAPLHELSWRDFAVNWETDVKMAFGFCKAALTRPLPAGSSIVMISSGAALAGSPNSGGYAGAKRTQLFIANYTQKESDRLGLGLRVASLVPRMMPGTDLGKRAVVGYARYLGVSEAEFVAGMSAPPTPAHVAAGMMALLADPEGSQGKAFIVSGNGLEVAP